MQPNHLVSIITPVYNGASFLEDLIISVRDQAYPSIEHIIIDDGSNDSGATIAILKKYSHLRWWSRKNIGQYATMNEGLQAASGDIICFISADDVIAENSIEIAVDYLSKHPTADGVYGKYSYIDETNAAYWYQPFIKRGLLKTYRYSPFIAHCSLYINKSKLLSHNLFFNQDLRFVGDYDWIVRLIDAGLQIGFVDKILSRIRWHSEQTTNKNSIAIKAELNQALKAHGVNIIVYRIINSSIDRFLLLKRRAGLLFFGHNERDLEQVYNWRKSKKGK